MRSMLASALLASLAGCADTTPPRFEPGASVTLTPSSARLEIVWPAVTDDGERVAYEVLVDGIPIARTTETTYSLDVPELAHRTVSILAVDGSGNRSTSLEAEVTMPDLTPPRFDAGARVTLTAAGAATDALRAVTLSWPDANDAGGVARYEVRSSAGPLGSTESTTLSLADVALGPDASFEVVALDGAGLRSAPLTVHFRDTPQALAEASPEAAPGSSPSGSSAARLRRETLDLLSRMGSIDEGAAVARPPLEVDVLGSLHDVGVASPRTPAAHAPGGGRVTSD